MHHSRAFSTALQVTRRLAASTRQLDIAMLVTSLMCCQTGTQKFWVIKSPYVAMPLSNDQCRRKVVLTEANTDVPHNMMLMYIIQCCCICICPHARRLK
jgi:hypothetical protein